MTNLEALADFQKISHGTGAFSWAWISKIKKVAKHFEVEPNAMMEIVYGPGWTIESAEAWLVKHKPKKSAT